MSVARISKQNLRKILTDNGVQDASCVVKFYSNNCPFCVRLKDEYHELSNSFDNLYFFVVNIDDDGDLDDLLQLNGVPSILFVNIVEARRSIAVMEDPEAPDEVTWYHPLDIKQFIESNIND
jgi:thiol-disulfide isomerase/thioredoxin